MVPTPAWLRQLLLAALILAASAGCGAATSTAATPPADPTQPQASVPPATHQSVFTRYRPLGSLTPLPWREANDTVTRIGGWRAYAREAAQPEPAPAKPQEQRHAH